MILKIAAFVIPLGFDTLAVAIALGLRGMRPLRPAITFACFEAAMPLVGLLIGHLAGARFQTPAVIAGGVVLLGVAAYMLREALEEGDETQSLSFSSMRMAILAGFGISMDELAIGFPMGTSGLSIPQTVAAIALQAYIVTFAGIIVGKRVGEAFGHRAARACGLIAAAAFALLGLYLILQRLIPGLPEV